MFLFLMILAMIRAAPDQPNETGDTRTISPDIKAENCRNYATAYYWDMYGALVATANLII